MNYLLVATDMIKRNEIVGLIFTHSLIYLTSFEKSVIELVKEGTIRMITPVFVCEDDKVSKVIG